MFNEICMTWRKWMWSDWITLDWNIVKVKVIDRFPVCPLEDLIFTSLRMTVFTEDGTDVFQKE